MSMFDRSRSRSISVCALTVFAVMASSGYAQAPTGVATAGYAATANVGGAQVTAGAQIAAPVGTTPALVGPAIALRTAAGEAAALLLLLA